MPPRKAQQKSNDDGLNAVLAELRSLREEVAEIKNKHLKNTASASAAPEIASSTSPAAASSAMAPSAQVAATSAQLSTPLAPDAAKPATSAEIPTLPAPITAPVPAPLTTALPSSASPAVVPSSSLPLMDIVPDNVRKDIIKGRDINLCQLLIPARERGCFTGGREIIIGDEKLQLKPLGDKRLSKMLTIQEFVKSFNTYKNIFCEAFPQRREEMDRYMSNIIEINAKYAGFAHYEYHLEFSARAAYYREHQNILIDWGRLDERLMTQVVGGRKALTCTLCGGYDHTATFCQLAAEANAGKSTLPCKYYNSVEGCSFRPCRFQHSCESCSAPGHGSTTCRKTMAVVKKLR